MIPAMSERVAVLLAGPSGSGKTRLARLSGCPQLRLDDFYLDHDHPGLPRTLGIVDWDDPASWDLDGAMAALRELLATGTTRVPTYSIPASARVGERELDLGSARVFIAEGIFAPQALAECLRTGVPVVPLYLDRPRALILALRLIRDLRQRRKSPWVLIRRGVALALAQPALRRKAVALGFEPVSMRAALRRLEAFVGVGENVEHGSARRVPTGADAGEGRP